MKGLHTHSGRNPNVDQVIQRELRTPVVDQPEPGFFKLRLASGCWYEVPCRILFEDGKWSAEIDGEPAGAANADPVRAPGVTAIWHTRKTPISAAEYEFLTGRLKEWAREFYPDHPLLHPKTKLNKATLRPIPQFTAPVAPAPLDPEPLPENRPGKPKPLTEKEIKLWLDFDNEVLTKAIELDVATLAMDAHETVDDDATLARVAANVDIARGHLRQANDTRLKSSKPFRDGAATVNAWFARYTTPLEAALTPVQNAMNAYGARVEAKRRAEAEAAATAARAELERLTREAAAAMERNAPAAGAILDEAADAAKAADKADALATGRAANLTRSYSSYGKTVSGRETWDFQVEDIAKVPLAYLQVNETEVGRVIRAFASANAERARAGESPIPGIRIIRQFAMR
jgi:hypothetical protein